MSGRDLFGALQDDLVQHVLSFLPSREAVKSATLARRWRHLWRSTPAVRVNGSGENFRLFVNSLLLHRDGASPLHSFEIEANLLVGGEDFDEFSDYEFDPREVDPHVDLWIRHAVWTCRARSLVARFQDSPVMWWPENRRSSAFPHQQQPFASPHLATMHLHRVQLRHDHLLDFSPCRELLNLTLSECILDGDALLSPWLERLSIIGCRTGIHRSKHGPMGMRIATPRLRHLQLSDDYDEDWFSRDDMDYTDLSSSLESMPLLTSASIQLIGTNTFDDDHATADRPLLLHGLAEATSLELIASTEDGRAILLKDLTWCPTFTKLKILMLNEWCVYDDVTALACLMQHTPRLENLILQLQFEKSHVLEVKTDNYITSEHSCHTFEHLKTVEIKKCRRSYDIRVKEILKLLGDWGIPSSKISINYKKSKDEKKHAKF